MSKATNFLAWLIEDINDVTAVVDSPRDVQLKEFAEQGFLRAAGSWHGTNIYEITNSGAFIEEDTARPLHEARPAHPSDTRPERGSPK